MQYVLKCSTDTGYYARKTNDERNEDNRSEEIQESEETRKWVYTIFNGVFLVVGLVGMIWVYNKAKKPGP